MQNIDYEAIDKFVTIAKENNWYYNLSTRAFIKPPQMPNIKCLNPYYQLTANDDDRELFNTVISHFDNRSRGLIVRLNNSSKNDY